MRGTTGVILFAVFAGVSGVAAQQIEGNHFNPCDEPVTAMALGETESAGAGGERAIFHNREYGDGVAAYFFNVDTSTCDRGIATRVYVEGSRGIVYGDEEPVESSRVTVVVGVFDRCLDTTLLSLTATGTADQLQINPGLACANLRTSIAGIDDSGNPVDITVDLVWNGAGHRGRDSFHSSDKFGGYRWVFNSTGTVRCAIAGGTVTVDSVDVTPLPSLQGGIEKNSERRLVVYR